MDPPSEQLRAPASIIEDPTRLDAASRVVAVQGNQRILEALRTLPLLETVWVTGVGSGAAAQVARLSRIRRLVVHDLRATDFTAWSALTHLESLAVAWGTKLRSLDGLEALHSLRELILFGCCNYSTLEPLQHLVRLETLCLEGGFSKQLRIASLRPLSGLHALRQLRLASLRVKDGSLEPLTSLKGLRHVFITKAFKPDELRRLAQALPDARGEFLDSHRS